MVGTVKQAAFGQALGRHAPPLRRRDPRHVILQAVLPDADQDHVLRAPGGLQDVDRQIRRGRLERKDRVGRVIFGTEQPAFLSGPQREGDRAARCRFGLQDARDVEQRGDAQPIVIRAGADRLALCIGRPDPVGIPMRAEHHRLARRGGAGDFGEDVVALDHLMGDRDRGREGRSLEHHRLERALPRGGAQRGEIESRTLEQAGRGIAAQPALQFQAGDLVGRADDIIRLALPGNDDVPAIARPRRIMDDQRADRAAPRHFLEFIGPAAIIGHRAPAELAKRGIALHRFEIGIVDQDDGDLAAQIDALEIVPAAFRGGDAVADEDERRVRDHRLVVRLERPDVTLFAARPGLPLALDRYAELLRLTELGVEQRHRLRPFPVGAAGFQPERLEPLGQIVDRHRFARPTRRAAVEGVGRNLLHGLGDRRGIYALCGDRCRDGEEGERDQALQHDPTLAPGQQPTRH